MNKKISAVDVDDMDSMFEWVITEVRDMKRYAKKNYLDTEDSYTRLQSLLREKYNNFIRR